MGDMQRCFEVVLGGGNCAAILPTREERLEGG